MKLSVTTSIILIATSVFPVEGQGGILINIQNSPVRAPTPKPTNNPTEQPSNNPYEANDNGCVNYPEGTTDDLCGSNNGLFDGNVYSNSYKCTLGGFNACCDSTIKNQSNVQDLGQCTRRYQEDDLGCIKYNDGYSDEGCFNAPFDGFDYSYSCQGGDKPYICCNSEEDFKSNVQNQGQCQRNKNNRRNLRRRA